MSICQNPQCNKEFKPTRHGQKYCGRECFKIMFRGHPPYNPKKRIIKKCLVCEKDFETGGRAGDPDQRFCSDECKYRGRYRHGEISKELTPQQASYIAGLMDGEGSFILYMRGDVVCLRINIANTKRAMLDWVVEATGIGSIVERENKNPNHMNSMWWQVNSEGAESVIKQIRPYLTIKQAQADLALKTQERLRDPSLKSDRSWQSDYHRRMQVLNKRGR